MSSQIEGTQSSLADLMLYEADGVPGVPLDDVHEVSCYVAALEHGLALLKGGLPPRIRLLNEIHAKLMAHGRGAGKAPGLVRCTQNWIGGASPAWASFVRPLPQRVGTCGLGDGGRDPFAYPQAHRLRLSAVSQALRAPAGR